MTDWRGVFKDPGTLMYLFSWVTLLSVCFWGLTVTNIMACLHWSRVSVPRSQGSGCPLGFPPVAMSDCKKTAHLGLTTFDAGSDGEVGERLIICLTLTETNM